MDEHLIFREYVRKLEMCLGSVNKGNCCCDLTLVQCHALVEIGRKENVSLKELSNIVNVDISTMSRTVDNLVNKKYVLRKTSENDRRITNIKLSEQGKEAFNVIETKMNEKFKKIYEDIDIEERKNILNSLSKLIDVFNKNK